MSFEKLWVGGLWDLLLPSFESLVVVDGPLPFRRLRKGKGQDRELDNCEIFPIGEGNFIKCKEEGAASFVF